jgi:DNA ligase-1
VKAFADLLERLVFTPSRNAKIALLRRYFETEPDPDRGIGLAAVTGELAFTTAKPGLIRELAAARTDPVLFAWSYDYVGDLAETVALMWPTDASPDRPPPPLHEVVETLETAPKAELPTIVAAWLDACDASVRFALLKLITGGLRVGVSARLAKIALAELAAGRIDPDDVEEVWHGLAPPYLPLFAWLEGRGERPDPADAPVFRPLMLANPLEPQDLASLDARAFRAEWKWDGIRVQLVATRGGRRLYSRGADDISSAFPEIIEAITFEAVLDGELLVVRDGRAAPFADLQQRLNRKVVSAKMMRDFPAAIHLYDILFDGTEDLRPLPFDERRRRLEAWFARVRPARMDLSPLIAFSSIEELSAIRDGARAASIEGLMLKRADSPYVPGRPKGQWWKWKRDPLTIDAVMMYAQRGHGKRSSYYSDYTFGLWRGDELVPVAKAYSGFTDQELLFLDRWVRNHTVARFGPVREVEKSLVLEIAFDAAQLSNRHKSGVAVRFPRVARIRTDKPVEEADQLETLMRLVENPPERAASAEPAVS